MSLSNTGFLYFAVLFYGLTFLILGLIPINSTVDSSSFSDNEHLNFFGNMVTNIQELPIIINFVLFGSLGIMVLYAIITTILGVIFNGGS